MEYNFQEIGDRIRNLRKASKKNQDDLVDALREVGAPTSRNTISGIENGDGDKLSLEILLGCCRLFGCDMGYLMGEYGDCKTRDNQFIHDQTGLSEKSIKRMVSSAGDCQNAFLEFILSSDYFGEIDDLFFQYIAYIKRSNDQVAWYIDAEKKLDTLAPDSDEAYNLNQRIGKALMTSANLENGVIAREHLISLRFNMMLDKYRENHLDRYKQ